MKKSPLLNAALSHLVAQLGHGDAVVVGDAGLPVPPGVLCIDLALTPGVPTVAQVLQALGSEMQVERLVLARETIADLSAPSPSWLPLAWQQLPVEQIPHESFKQRCQQARAVVRTGECTPYTNVMLLAGVTF